MAATVLDSYALLAFLRGEDADGEVRKLLERASDRNQPLHMTEISYSEVKYIILRKEGRARWVSIAAGLVVLPLEFHPITRVLADLAADFKAEYRISLADAFAAALANEKKAELVTGDPEFKPLENKIKIKWIGGSD
ncbi:MAG TPA: PIN domain-containing protein [Candidatus Hydrogenedentes bacterium]|nr:PIN domain-containing protein [Candidatus Hydrogenedentota bacterium]